MNSSQRQSAVHLVTFPLYLPSGRHTASCPPHLPHAARTTLQTLTLASTRSSKLFLAAVALFITVSAILASLRLAGRSPSLLQHLKPGSLRHPLYTQPFRTLTNSTMAPEQYRSPPQLPPKFTATKDSLIKDTQKLVGWQRRKSFCESS
jgi:hypothetical protein